MYGFIASNTTLTFAPPGPIYDVLGDVIVNPGVSLIVEPGVTLRFAANHDTLKGGTYQSLAELTVRGTLTADATTGDTIRFVGSGGGSLEWGHLRSEAAGSLTLRRVRLHGARTGLLLHGTGDQVVENALLTGCQDGIQATAVPATLRQVAVFGLGPGSGIGLDLGPGVQTAPADSLNPTPSLAAKFQIGVRLIGDATVRNILVRDNTYGFDFTNSANRTINYCTAVRNLVGFRYVGNTTVLNCIAALNTSIGFYIFNATYTDYVNSWNNPANYYFDGGGVLGPNNASFDPFFVDPSADDFRLASNSIFKHYSNSGGEIGAYGPGECPPLLVGPSGDGTTASLRASPNPTREAAVLEFVQTTPGRVTVDILDVLGRRIEQVLDGFREAGTHRIVWHGKDESGGGVPPGLYFWRVSDGRGIRTGRQVVSR